MQAEIITTSLNPINYQIQHLETIIIFLFFLFACTFILLMLRIRECKKLKKLLSLQEYKPKTKHLNSFIM